MKNALFLANLPKNEEVIKYFHKMRMRNREVLKTAEVLIKEFGYGRRISKREKCFIYCQSSKKGRGDW